MTGARFRSRRHTPRHKPPSRLERVRSSLSPHRLPRQVAVAAVAGGLLVTSGAAGSAVFDRDTEAAAAQHAGPAVTVAAGERGMTVVSRDSERPALSEPKADAVTDENAPLGSRQTALEAGSASSAAVVTDPRAIARGMLIKHGWSASEFSCLDALWVGESDWEWNADNPTSSAYGIPQALPGEKMASAGSDWETNPATQIEWGLGYIHDVYGTPCAANDFKIANNWY